jgi:hypothetical protein
MNDELERINKTVNTEYGKGKKSNRRFKDYLKKEDDDEDEDEGEVK